MTYNSFASGLSHPLLSSSPSPSPLPPLPRVVPAQLAYLAIYNPSLGPTEDSFHQQLVYYYSRLAHENRLNARKLGRDDRVGADADKKEENERLRRIGLVQGLIGFVSTFSKGQPIDVIDTEKTRAVVQELERGWWLVASIDLTQLPTSKVQTSNADDTRRKAAATASKKGEAEHPSSIEYSSREVSPPILLLQQIQQAHRIFALHHGPSLADLYSRLGRERFCGTLDRFWTRFSRTWNVLLHGNPAADVVGGIKLAAGGELGFGVGEEEWGSGERDVLEDMVRRTEGMLDMFVSRFGEPARSLSNTSFSPDVDALPWLGGGNEPTATDGVVFAGTGALTRASLRDVTTWTRHVYLYGERAYGVRDNPARERRNKRRRADKQSFKDDEQGDVLATKQAMPTKSKKQTRAPRPEVSRATTRASASDVESAGHIATIPAGIPPPIVSAAEMSLSSASEAVDRKTLHASSTSSEGESGTTLGIPDQYMKYLTLGLSTLGKSNASKRPGISSRKASAMSQSQRSDPGHESTVLASVDPIPDGESRAARILLQKQLENRGHFAIGLKGDLDGNASETVPDADPIDSQEDADGSRVILRTIHVELMPVAGDTDETILAKDSTSARPPPERFPSTSTITASKRHQRVRVLLYVKRPFIFCMLFESRTSSLQYAHFYKDLHRNLEPIHRPLLSSTDVAKAAQRLCQSHIFGTVNNDSQQSQRRRASAVPSADSGLYELIYDPQTLTLHTSIPNIPDPGTPAAEGILTGSKSHGGNGASDSVGWTRIDALNVHHHVLNTLVNVRRQPDDLEITSKTSRGWWIVWVRMNAQNVRPEVGMHEYDDGDPDDDDGTTEEDEEAAVVQDDFHDETQTASRTGRQPNLVRSPPSNSSNITTINISPNTRASSNANRSPSSDRKDAQAVEDSSTAQSLMDKFPLYDPSRSALVNKKLHDHFTALPSPSSNSEEKAVKVENRADLSPIAFVVRKASDNGSSLNLYPPSPSIRTTMGNSGAGLQLESVTKKKSDDNVSRVASGSGGAAGAAAGTAAGAASGAGAAAVSALRYGTGFFASLPGLASLRAAPSTPASTKQGASPERAILTERGEDGEVKEEERDEREQRTRVKAEVEAEAGSEAGVKAEIKAKGEAEGEVEGDATSQLRLIQGRRRESESQSRIRDQSLSKRETRSGSRASRHRQTSLRTVLGMADRGDDDRRDDSGQLLIETTGTGGIGFDARGYIQNMMNLIMK